MVDARKKSPRAPSMHLEEAIERAIKVYEKERRHPAPAEAVAQDMGYKTANNGAALSALASLRYFGLLERQGNGQLAVTKDVESYQFAPSDALRQGLRVKWLRTPPVFGELLEKYQGGLPSEATLKYELIQKGFLPHAADSTISVFRKSVEFARPFAAENEPDNRQELVASDPDADAQVSNAASVKPNPEAALGANIPNESGEFDRIPVRLSGQRKAWLVIPTPFYAADKDRLKAQIDLLLTEDGESLV
jgi:hypothetical protein